MPREYTAEERAHIENNIGVDVEHLWVAKVLAWVAGFMLLGAVTWMVVVGIQKSEQREQERVAVHAQVAETVEAIEANIESGLSVAESVAAVGGDSTIRSESFQDGEEFFVHAARVTPTGRFGNYAYVNYGYNSILGDFVHGTYNEVKYAHVPKPDDD